MRLSRKIAKFIRAAHVAHLATADAKGQPHVIPICFAFDGEYFYSPIDQKPKRVAARKLKRTTNIRENPNVSLVIDRYEEDWRKLAYILVFGKAQIVLSGKKYFKAIRLLRKKYAQYQTMAIDERPMIVIKPKRIIGWGAM
jgi:coenzyme F420-0:L-glutamate ligase/coenzyme F420-1:gamma-L-glutamate ligase